MNNENNNGMNIPNGVNNNMPNQQPAGLNDIINNNANVNPTPVGPSFSPQGPTPVAPMNSNPVNPTPTPAPVMPSVNPVDQVVTPINNMNQSNMVQNTNPISMDNEVVMPSQPMEQHDEKTYSATQNSMGIQNPTPASPMPQNMGTPNVMPSGQPLPNFETPNSIGVNPPINNNNTQKEKKEKKGMNKTLFVLFLLVLIAAIGGGVYWYLNLSGNNNSINVQLKDVVYDLNEEPSTDITTYATITGTNSSSCELDTSKINTAKIGQYEYVITCSGKAYTGKATVADTAAPIVSTISVTKTVNSQLSASDFIGTCYDSSECSYVFEDEASIKTLMTTVGGPTTVKIIVSDKNDNKTTVEGKLNVIQSEVKAMYECSSAGQKVENYNATMTLTHSLGILGDLAADGSYVFGNFGTQTYLYKFTDQEQFEKLLKEFKKDKQVKINDVTGIASFDAKESTVKIVSDLDLTNFKTQYGEDKFTSFKTIQDLYKTTLGYTCTPKTN